MSFAPEVRMEGFGNVDFVIADVDQSNNVRQFLSVELQAIDITGSVYPAYESMIQNNPLPSKPSYSFNWDNVYKRFITQLIRKGYYHHHWNSKIVAIIQEAVYQNIRARADFITSNDLMSPNVNIIFLTYDYEEEENGSGYTLTMKTIAGTHHSNLQSAILYKTPPSRDAFCSHIIRNLRPLNG
ncbi:MAG: hypothetical protein HY910_01920 [Desulfarculus sp.]|nr:hypothetical protein [Desulfarculus sp.]